MTAAEPVLDDSVRGGPFSPLTAALMAVVGAVAFAALMVLFTYAPDLRGGDNGQAHALSRSAVGFAGVVEALRLAGDPVVVNRAPLRAGPHAGLLVVTPTPAADLKAIRALTFGGPVLVVLPKWAAGPDPAHRGWVGRTVLIDTAWLPPTSLMRDLQMSRRIGISRPVLSATSAGAAPLQAGPVDAFQTISAPGWISVRRDETGRTVLARVPGDALFVLSDPDLLDNRGLKSVDTLSTGLALLAGLNRHEASAPGAYIFDVRLNGLGRERSVLRLLFDPPFLAVTLCLAAAAALAAVQAFCRFGPVIRAGRAIAPGKTALVDNTAALIRLAGREHRMGGRYAELTADLTARAVGAPRGLGGEALTTFLDALGAQKRLPDGLSELAIQARMAGTAERLVAAARRLYAWRLDMTSPGAPSRAPVSPPVSPPASPPASPPVSPPAPKDRP